MQLNQPPIIPENNLENSAFIQLNQQPLAELLTFVDFADNKLTIGFVAVNFAEDRNTLIEILKNHPQCQDIQFVVCNLADPNLRFIRDVIIEELRKIKKEENKKLFLIIIGLEKSIGFFGEYPPVLQDLNFIRDAFTNSVPHPILFFLHDDALKRLAKYAPDFWAWRKGVFYFQTAQSTKELAIERTIKSERRLESLDLPEKQERIDLLERLLMESVTNIRNRITILGELGVAYRSIGELKKAKDCFVDALNLIDDDEKLAEKKGSVLQALGIIYTDLGEWDKAFDLYHQSLEITERTGHILGKAAILNELGMLYANQGELDKAITFYNQSLEITESIDHVLGKATILHQLGMIYANQGLLEKAIALFNQSLEIKELIGDAQGKAATLHELGSIYAKKGELESAFAFFNQSLEIKERIGNVQGKAATLQALGSIYAKKGELEQAINLLNQSWEISQKIGNVQGQAHTLSWLGYIAQQQGDYKKAISYLQPALEILQRIQSPDAENVRLLLDEVQQKTGEQP